MTDESVIVFLLERRKTLESFFFNGLYLSDEAYRHLAPCQSLHALGISNAEFMFSSGISAISNLHFLLNLRINYAQHVTATDFITLFSNKNLQYLMQLDLGRCYEIDDEVVKTIALNCPNLESLALNGCNKLTDFGMKYLIRRCNNLLVLYLRGLNNLTDQFLYQINEWLPNILFINLKNHGPSISKYCLEHIVNSSKSDLTVIDSDGHIIESHASHAYVSQRKFYSILKYQV